MQNLKDLLVYVKHEHNRAAFDCESSGLTRYIQNDAQQHQKRNLSKTYVLLNNNDVTAFFTLLVKTIEFDPGQIQLSKDLQEQKNDEQKIGIPGVLLGALARDITLKHTNLGDKLIYEAMRKSFALSKIVGIKGMFLEAETDEICKKFYDKLNYLKHIEGRFYYVPMKMLQEIFKDEDIESCYKI